MKRFHNYINYGTLQKPKVEKEEKKESKKEKEREAEKAKVEAHVKLVKHIIENHQSVTKAINANEIDISKHRVYYNKNLQCISSNLILISSNKIKECAQDFVN